jgi:dCTP deaminase
MTVLADHDIIAAQKSGPIIDPFDEACVQPASYDVHLGDSFRKYRSVRTIDPQDSSTISTREILSNSLIIKPGEFFLGSTQEKIDIPGNIVARVEGKSSLGRIGLIVHATAGFIDPGFKGILTLELYNCNAAPIQLRAGMKIAQISFTYLTQSASRPYGHPELGSHYQHQTAATESRF